ncbi:MAG: DUF5916 domain-containing protein [Pseudomonadales bacterium]
MPRLSLNTGETLIPPRFEHATADIKIDGVIDERVWQEATKVTDFTVIEPDTMGKPRWPTTLMLLYTERGLYAAYDMEQPQESIVAVFSPRDTATAFSDFVGLVLDTSGDGKYGYWVSLAASGVKSDGTLIPESQFNRDWDGAWYGGTSRTERGWSAEIFMPWSQLAMPQQEGKRQISIFASRKSVALGERWGVPALPFTITKWIQNMRPMELSQVDPKQQWSVIPYASVTQDEVRSETKSRAGAELFWRPSTNFQLSASILPDFGNVESDDVVVNLSALETFFPEKRLFFLEGRDIFNTSPRADPFRNFSPVTLVNTRRIGGTPRPPNVPNTVTVPIGELQQQAELHAAVKTTGQIGAVRYGFLAASEDDTDFETLSGRFGQTGSDYGTARILWEDSSFGGYRAIGAISTLVSHTEQDAVVHGLDYHFLTPNGRWKLDGQFMYSDKDEVGEGWGGFADILYTIRRGLRLKLDLSHFDTKLDINDLGFLRRNGVSRVNFAVDYTNPNLNWARWLEYDLNSVYEVNHRGDVTRQGFAMGTDLRLNNLAKLETTVFFFGRRTDDLESFGNGDFTIASRWESEFDYFSDPAEKLSYQLGFSLDQEKTDGHAISARAGIIWRAAQNLKIDLLAEYIRRDGWLLHQELDNFTTFETREWRPKISADLFLTARQQIRLSAQWIAIKAKEERFYKIPSNAGELQEGAKPAGPSDDFNLSNLSFQLRYRWELGPLSDLFLVYTLNGLDSNEDAGFSELFESSHQNPIAEQLVLKLRYRFGS